MSTSSAPVHAHAVRGLGLLVVAMFALVASAAGSFAATPVQQVKSPGGIEAWLIESHDVGLITVRVAFEGGALAEPVGREGVANMMAFMFNEGAGDMDTDALSSRRQKMGVNFGGWANHTAVGLTFSTPSAQRREAFALLKLALYAPRYDDAAIERARREYSAALAAEAQQPGAIATERLSQRQFGTSRLATSVYGTPESLARLNRDDIKAYRARAFARNNMKVAVAGDITPAELAPLLDELFGALPAQTDVPAKPMTIAQTPSSDFKRMEIPQSVVIFGNAVPRLTWRQSLRFAIANQILSAPFTGRLFREVREKRGLVYSISSQSIAVGETSVFLVGFGAGGENAREALRESQLVIDRFLADGVTEAEVEIVKEAFIGGFFLGLDTNDKLVAQVLDMLRRDLPITYLDDFASEIGQITAADVTAVIRQMIRPDITNVSIVGNPPGDFPTTPAASR